MVALPNGFVDIYNQKLYQWSKMCFPYCISYSLERANIFKKSTRYLIRSNRSNLVLFRFTQFLV